MISTTTDVSGIAFGMCSSAWVLHNNSQLLCEAAIDNTELSNRMPLILIHGITASEDMWEDFLNYYANDADLRQHFKPYLVRYASKKTDAITSDNNSIYKIAGILHDQITNFATATGKADFDINPSSIVILAHSMGGLVARSFMQEYECGGQQCGNKVKKLITLATPHHGSFLSNYYFTNPLYSLLLDPGGMIVKILINKSHPDILADLLGDGSLNSNTCSSGNRWLRCLNSYLPVNTSQACGYCEGLYNTNYDKNGLYDKLVLFVGNYNPDPAVTRHSGLFQGDLWTDENVISPQQRMPPLPYCTHSSIYRNERCSHGTDSLHDVNPLDKVRDALRTIAGISTVQSLVVAPDMTKLTDPTLTAFWTQPVGSYTGFQIVDVAENPISPVLPTTTFKWSKSTLGYNKKYTWAVETITDSGRSRSEYSTGVTIPSKPGGFSATQIDFSRINLTMASSAPQGVSGTDASAVSYLIMGATDQLMFNSADVAWSETSNAPILGLVPNTTYWFKIRAVNEDGWFSEETDTISVCTAMLPVSVSTSSVALATPMLGKDGKTAVLFDDIPSFESSLYIATDPISTPILTTPSYIRHALGTMAYRFTADIPIREFVLYMNNAAYEGPITASLTIPYQDANGDGIVDDTVPPLEATNLQPYTLSGQQWVQASDTWTLDSVAKTVTFSVTHFSVFSLNGPTPQDIIVSLANVKIFPTPWKQGTGGKFDSADIAGCGRGLVFKNLTADANIKIYNIQGDLVRELTVTSSDNGCKAWDGKNNSGASVASGVYISLIKNSAGEKVAKKIAIER
ncbi:MAG: Serine hydroxymethyltransferase [Parcubacteria group bacterium GW2011_GWF2_50_9]|nr:MAG: Serine hydroxymethyltransferase [Parcubacteria group bacterium GW2011_GWF2_50_9]